MTRGKAGPAIRPGGAQAVGTGARRRACWGPQGGRHWAQAGRWARRRQARGRGAGRAGGRRAGGRGAGRAGSRRADGRQQGAGRAGHAQQGRGLGAGRAAWACWLALCCALGALCLFSIRFDSVLFLSQFLDVVREPGS